MAFSTVFTRKSGVFLQIWRKKLAFFGVNFILQKFCLCKKMTNMRYVQVMTSFLNSPLVGMESMKSYSGLSSMCTRQYRSPQIIKYFTKDVDTTSLSSMWVCTIQPQFDVISSYMLIESFCSESIGKQPYIRKIYFLLYPRWNDKQVLEC